MKNDSDNPKKTSIDKTMTVGRQIIFGVVGHIDNIEQQVDTPLGSLFICSIPGEDKKQPHRNYKSGEHIVSEDFVFVGQDGERIVIIVGDGVTNKGKGGREAAQICYTVTETLWNSSKAIGASNLFKRWHEAIANSDYPEGSVAVTIIIVEPWSFPKAPKIVAKAQFYNCGDVKGSMHTATSRFADTPYFSTPLHRKEENNKLYKAATGLKYYPPERSPILFCHGGDVLHNSTDGVEDFEAAMNKVMMNRDINFDDLPLHLQGELYLAMLEKKSEHLLLSSKVKRKEKINLNLFEKYARIDNEDEIPSMKIKALDDMTSVMFQIKT